MQLVFVTSSWAVLSLCVDLRLLGQTQGEGLQHSGSAAAGLFQNKVKHYKSGGK